MSKVYSPRGYWKRLTVIKKLTDAAKVSEEDTKKNPGSTSPLTNVCQSQNMSHGQNPMSPHPTRCTKSTFFSLPHDTLGRGRGRGRKTFKYALTVFDVASRVKEAEPLKTQLL